MCSPITPPVRAVVLARATTLPHAVMRMIPDRLWGMLALLTVTVVWGTTFPAVKALTVHFSALWIVLLRFSLAALLLSPWLVRIRRAELVGGALLGLPLFCSFLFQIEGLALSSANRNAFIYGLNALMVPLLGLVSRRAIGPNVALGMLLALAGVGSLCWEDGAWGRADNLALLGALSFAVYIKLMEAHTEAGSRLMALTAVQIVTVALCAGACLVWRAAAATDITPSLPTGLDWRHAIAGMQAHAVNLAYLGAIATAAIISLQAWGQRRTSANEAASIYAFEPAAAAVFSAIWLGESMTARTYLGAGLLILGMIVCQWRSAPSAATAASQPLGSPS